MHRTTASARRRVAFLSTLAAAAALTLAPPGSDAGGEGAPGLGVGDNAPRATVKTIEGKSVELESLYGQTPLVITFYRGGWCPFCNRALSAWGEALPEIEAAGARWIAITPEQPSYVAETGSKIAGEPDVYSDFALRAASAFGIAFDVDAETRKTYEGYGIDLAARNANGEWRLPHPATFVVDAEGVIRFAEVHTDYRKRTEPEDVLAVLREF